MNGIWKYLRGFALLAFLLAFFGWGWEASPKKITATEGQFCSYDSELSWTGVSASAEDENEFFIVGCGGFL